LTIFQHLFAALNMSASYPAVVRYQAITTLGFIISTSKSRSYVDGFREQLVQESIKLIGSCKYDKYFDIVMRMFT
jgi:hypothetical protein